MNERIPADLVPTPLFAGSGHPHRCKHALSHKPTFTARPSMTSHSPRSWPCEYRFPTPSYWRHYLNDITVFTTFIRHVMENIEQFISREAGGKRGEKGTRASKGEGTGRRKTGEDASSRALPAV